MQVALRSGGADEWGVSVAAYAHVPSKLLVEDEYLMWLSEYEGAMSV